MKLAYFSGYCAELAKKLLITLFHKILSFLASLILASFALQFLRFDLTLKIFSTNMPDLHYKS